MDESVMFRPTAPRLMDQVRETLRVLSLRIQY